MPTPDQATIQEGFRLFESLLVSSPGTAALLLIAANQYFQWRARRNGKNGKKYPETIHSCHFDEEAKARQMVQTAHLEKICRGVETMNEKLGECVVELRANSKASREVSDGINRFRCPFEGHGG